MAIYINESYPDNETMDIILGELEWKEDEDGWSADGLLSYDIDRDFELAVFRGEKCLEIRECIDDKHAKWMADAFECTALRNQARGHNWYGVKGALTHAGKNEDE